ncbi:MAG: hypothetical protein EXR09_07075 [Acetobacteraceae bacterium]|nr:hypothetical protein [Acetobacteraceae bacterium]
MPDAVLYSPSMIAPRHAWTVLLARLAYGLFYLDVAMLVLGVPVGLSFLMWRWLMGLTRLGDTKLR